MTPDAKAQLLAAVRAILSRADITQSGFLGSVLGEAGMPHEEAAAVFYRFQKQEQEEFEREIAKALAEVVSEWAKTGKVPAA